MVKYKSITDIIEKLNQFLEDKQEQYENESNKDYPNDDRLDKLESQIECLENAIDALNDYEA